MHLESPDRVASLSQFLQSPFDQSPALTAFEQSFIERFAPLFGTLTTRTKEWTTIDTRRCLDADAIHSAVCTIED